MSTIEETEQDGKDEPQEAQDHADDQAGRERSIEREVVPLDIEIAGQTPEPSARVAEARQFPCQHKQAAQGNEQDAPEYEHPPQPAEPVHGVTGSAVPQFGRR